LATQPWGIAVGGFERFCWFITLIAAVVAGVLIVFDGGLVLPQVVSIVVIPYVFTRSVEALGRENRAVRAAEREAIEKVAADLHRANVADRLERAAMPVAEAEEASTESSLESATQTRPSRVEPKLA
jgi:hypothetical protein